MTKRFSLIKSIQEKQISVRHKLKSIRSSYNPIAGRTSVDMATYQRTMNEVNKLNDEILTLTREAGKMSKENNKDDIGLQTELQRTIAGCERLIKDLEHKIEYSVDWGKDALRANQQEIAYERDHARNLLALL